MKMKSMADIMRKTSVVSLQEDGLPSSLIRRTPPPRPPPQRDVRVGLRLGASSSATRADDVTRARKPPLPTRPPPPPPPLHTKRRREVYDDNDDDASRARKKKRQHEAEPSARVTSVVNTTSRPSMSTAARAASTRTKESAPSLAHCSASRRARENRRGRGQRRRSREISASATRRPQPAQDVLRSAIARARVFMDRREEIAALREEARREVASMVRTVEFNDPYISIADVFKP